MLKRKAPEPPAEVQPQIVTDPVTGLHARGYLEDWATAHAQRAQAQSTRHVLVFLDLGQLTDVSDIYGPDISDQLLAMIAQRLQAALESGQQLCHYHGAEVALLVPGVTTIAAAQDFCDHLLALVAEPVTVGDAEIASTVSAGAALSDSGYGSTQEWIQDAHMALAEARELGHRRAVIRDESTRNRVDVRVTPTRVLKGWGQREFSLMYQPIVNASEHRIVGFEALMRWRDPGASGTFIGPDQFIHLLEKTGLIVPVGDWVVTEAIGQLKDWVDDFVDFGPLFVKINVGARQLAHAGFSESVVKALDLIGLPPEQLVLDITEDALRFNKSAVWGALRDLKYLGIRIALGDFGVGEAGLSYLRQLPLDFVSIHRSFLQGLGETPEDTAVVKYLIQLGRELGITTIVEGVENTKQDELLATFDPELIQGFYYSRPELPDTIGELLKRGQILVGSEAWMGGIGSFETGEAAAEEQPAPQLQQISGPGTAPPPPPGQGDGEAF